MGQILNTGLGNGIITNKSPTSLFQIDNSIDTGINNLISAYLLTINSNGVQSQAPGFIKWGGTTLGQAVTLTTSFATSSSVYAYSSTDVLGAQVFTSVQINAAIAAMNEYAAVAKITFTQVTDSTTQAGDIRWGNSSDLNLVTAHAYFPYDTPQSGDIWFGSSYYSDYQNPASGSYGYITFIHELGHALGLVHPHDSFVAPVSNEDQLKYTVMSYRDFAGDSLNGYSSQFYPTSLMLNDIAAIQYMYGVNTSYNAGNTIYQWGVSDNIYETIWDGGGIDTINASNQAQGVVLNLNSGQWSEIGVAFWNGQAYVRNNLTIAYGTTIENAIGSDFNDSLIGNSVANTLTGGLGNDTLDGGTGNDTLVGGLGDDAYYINVATDVITESAGEGTDTVYSTATYTLGSTLENLTLAGTAVINGTGNSADNLINGNTKANKLYGLEGNDTLDGGLGNDTLTGGAGDDLYIVDATGDVVTESANAGVDLVHSTASAYTLGANIENLTLIGEGNQNGTGNTLANRITGNVDDNILDGGTGADILIGGLGNDTYVVDNSSDIATELAGEGTDLVQSSITITTLAAFVENLTLTGATAINGTGNDLDNLITGNSKVNILTGGLGNDTLDGGTGNDTLVGGLGDDAYYINVATDVITESAGEGTDTVYSTATYTLGSTLENLTLAGTAVINGTGNSTDNLITGNTKANKLYGLEGNDTLDGSGDEFVTDTLYGGNGDDTYIVDGLYSADAPAGDIIVELATDTGVDTIIFASSSYNYMPDNIENAVLMTTSVLYGNKASNLIIGSDSVDIIYGGRPQDEIGGYDTIYGGGGDDLITSGPFWYGHAWIDGGTGADNMVGGANDDIYIIDNIGDQVQEYGTSMNDYVYSTADINGNVQGYVDHIVLQGNASINCITEYAFSVLGNSGDNYLSVAFGATTLFSGGDGDDTMEGGGGSDIMTGGNGSDTFFFTDKGWADTITDFTHAVDQLQFDTHEFTYLPSSSEDLYYFESGAGLSSASTSTIRLFYDTTTSGLYYDNDGNGSIQAKLIATFTNAAELTTGDFIFV